MREELDKLTIKRAKKLLKKPGSHLQTARGLKMKVRNTQRKIDKMKEQERLRREVFSDRLSYAERHLKRLTEELPILEEWEKENGK